MLLVFKGECTTAFRGRGQLTRMAVGELCVQCIVPQLVGSNRGMGWREDYFTFLPCLSGFPGDWLAAVCKRMPDRALARPPSEQPCWCPLAMLVGHGHGHGHGPPTAEEEFYLPGPDPGSVTWGRVTAWPPCSGAAGSGEPPLV